MKYFWCSWVHHGGDDYRPLTFPPNPTILGWWCTGYTSDESPIICAAVAANTRQFAKKAVQKDWPEMKRWRFIEARSEWPEVDRFPLSDWMKPRMKPFMKAEVAR